MSLLFVRLLSGQEHPRQKTGFPDDWSHHHLIFSDAGTSEQAVRSGTLDRWLRITHDPRYVLEREKRDAAAKGKLNFDQMLPPVDDEPPEKQDRFRPPVAGVNGFPRGLTPATRSAHLVGAPVLDRPNHWRVRSPLSLDEDWSENMGSGATVGLGMYPAKYSFAISSANCGSATEPDFVVYNTSLAGSSTQASIIAYDNLYTGCSGTVPATYWAYNTGGTVVTSVALSLDGSQLAFAQTNSAGVATLVLLKWKASTTESAGAPATPTAATASSYRTCTAPCSLTLEFSGTVANDSASSVFCDYSTDTLYVGDDAGQLHKFSGVFQGTPAEITSSWPISVSSSPLGSPVYDSSSGNVFVGDYLLNLTSYCGSTGETCGHLYSIDSSSGSIAGMSAQLDYNFGVVDAPLVDSSAGRAFVFVGADANFGSASACGTDVPCSGVFEFPTNFTSGNGTEATVGPGYQFLMAGTFDNEYFSSSDASTPTGHLYVVGNTGPANNALFQISINAGVMSTSATSGPTVSANYTNGYYSAGLDLTEIYTGSKDYVFLSVLSYGEPASCSSTFGNGCVMGFDVTSGTISSSTTPTAATTEAGGTSGIIIDNTSTFAGASNIYYTPLANQSCPNSGTSGGCAIQISQSTP
jgi:hypothetical protein